MELVCPHCCGVRARAWLRLQRARVLGVLLPHSHSHVALTLAFPAFTAAAAASADQVLWNFVLSAALGTQRLLVQLGLDGFLPGGWGGGPRLSLRSGSGCGGSVGVGAAGAGVAAAALQLASAAFQCWGVGARPTLQGLQRPQLPATTCSCPVPCFSPRNSRRRGGGHLRVVRVRVLAVGALLPEPVGGKVGRRVHKHGERHSCFDALGHLSWLTFCSILTDIVRPCLHGL